MEITKKELKEILENQREEYQDYLGGVAEDFKSQVKLIAEQHGSIIEILNSHTEMIAAVKEDIEIMKLDIEFIKNSLKKKVDIEEFFALEKRVLLLEKKISR